MSYEAPTQAKWDFGVRFGMFAGIPAGAVAEDGWGWTGVAISMAVVAVIAVGALLLAVLQDLRRGTRA